MSTVRAACFAGSAPATQRRERNDRTLDARVLPASLTGDPELVATEAEVNHEVASTVGTIGERVSTDTIQWHTAAMVIWLAGALGLLLANIIRTVRFLQRLKTEVAAPDASVERLVQRLSRYVGLRRPPRVVISNSDIGPAVFGVLRPTVILPLALVHDRRPTATDADSVARADTYTTWGSLAGTALDAGASHLVVSSTGLVVSAASGMGFGTLL